MKIKNIKLTAVLLSLMLIAGMLGACGQKKDVSEGSATVSKASTASAKTEAKTTVKPSQTSVSASSPSDTKSPVAAQTAGNVPAPAEVVPNTENNDNTDNSEIKEEYQDIKVELGSGFEVGNYDLGGKTIVIAAWGDTVFPSDKEGASPDQVARYLRLKEAEKKYNFKTEYRLIANFNNYRDAFLSETLAGVKFADVIRTQAILSFPTHASQNMIVPLDDYIDFNSKIIQQNQYMIQGSYWNGKHYGINFTWEIAYPRVFYNKAILDREGQPDILDLVEADQWNWTTFLDILVNTTKDLNGDGITDQWGISALTGYGNSICTNMLYSNGVSFLSFVDGKAICNLDSAPARRALQFASDLNFVYKVYTQETGAVGTPQKYMSGSVAIYLNAPWYHRDSIKTGMQTFLAPLPKGPDTDIYSNTYSSNFDAITITCENPEAVSRIWMDVSMLWDEDGNWIKEYQELLSKFPYDWNWSSANPNRTYTTEREHKISMLALYPLWRTDYLLGYPSTLQSNIINNTVFNPILNGTKSVSQVLNEQMYNIQAAIDQYN